MSDFHHFVIEGSDSGFTSKITLDGVDLKGVTLFEFTVDPNDRRRPTVLRLDFIPGSVNIDAHGKLIVQGEER